MNLSILTQYDSQYTYFVGNCDAATTAFVKKTLPCEEPSFVFISGLPGVHASFEILETSICKNKTTPLIFQTNLMIGQDIDVLKLGELLKQHVRLFDIRIMCEEDLENQDIAPINAILDVLGGGNTGSFLLLGLPIELLLRSHWVERLGGAAKVEAWEDKIGAVRVRPKYPHGTRPGLTIWRGEKEYDTDSDYEEDNE